MTKVLRYSAALLFVTALSLFMGGSAAAQFSNNPRYQQFRDTAAASISNPSTGNVRLFFDSTGFYWKNSSGTTTAVGGTLSGLTTGVIPMAGSATTIVNSKMTATAGGSSTGKGVWTLYDDTATVGSTAFTIRAGAGQSTNPLAVMYANDGTTARYTFASTGILTATIDSTNDLAIKAGRSGNTGAVQIGDRGWGAGGEIDLVTGGNTTLVANALNGLEISAGHTLLWSASGAIIGARDLGLARSAAGILKVTDGSTGQGGIGLSDAATNTVSDALILRHATSGTAAASFGTGLLFQGEDAAGNMQDMASIDAVWNTATDTNEHSSLVFKNYHLGAESTMLTMMSQFSETYLTAAGPLRLVGSDVGLNSTGGSVMYFSLASDNKWSLATPGNWVPAATNTYDIGTSSAVVREIFARTVTSDSNLVLGAGNADQIVMGSTYFGTTGGSVNVLNLGYAGAEFASAYVTTSIQGTRTQAITDNAAAATFVTIAVPTSNTTVGGRIFYTITAIDAGTAIQTKTGTYSFGLNNIGGTVTGAGTDVLEHSQLSAGTLAPTFSVNISGTNAQFQLVLDTSLDAAAETLKIEYRVQIDSGTATVTPAT